jgi:hypothetical protein
MHSISLSLPAEVVPAVHVVDYLNRREALHFHRSGQLQPKLGAAEVCIAVDAPSLFEQQHAGQLLTLLIDRKPTVRELRTGQLQILPALNDETMVNPDWTELALELLDFNLLGRGPLQLGVDDLLAVLAGNHSKKLHFTIIRLGQLDLPLAPPLRFKNLYAKLLCPPDCTYQSYLEIAVTLIRKLPAGAPLRIGLTHTSDKAPLLLLLGELAIR